MPLALRLPPRPAAGHAAPARGRVGAAAARPPVLAARARRTAHARRIHVAATGGAGDKEDGPPPTVGETEAAAKAKAAMLKSLRESGVDKATATKILEAWAATGATDPSSLRRLLVGRAAAAGGRLAVQALLDAGAAAGAFAWGASLDAAPPFPGKGVVQALTFVLAGYFATGFASACFLGGAAAFAAARYGANAGAVLAAVREVAGADGATGVSVVDSAAAAANSLKLITALNEIADLLGRKDGGAGAAAAGGAPSAADTLKSLSALLTLARAEEKGFDPAALGLTRAQAGDLAAAFARADANDDMVLQPEELASLCRAEGYDLSDADVAAAARLLDADGDGAIQFPDFAAWRVNKLRVPLPPAQ